MTRGAHTKPQREEEGRVVSGSLPGTGSVSVTPPPHVSPYGIGILAVGPVTGLPCPLCTQWARLWL